ncbi:hypothetical protein FRC17_001084 [Serendipita sp. 399]|nr:hypothetical protein FRC17_001084 [Serendipita sp. 399]
MDPSITPMTIGVPFTKSTEESVDSDTVADAEVTDAVFEAVDKEIRGPNELAPSAPNGKMREVADETEWIKSLGLFNTNITDVCRRLGSRLAAEEVVDLAMDRKLFEERVDVIRFSFEE